MAEQRGLDFIGVQIGDQGIPVGPNVNADVFIVDQIHGLVMRDRVNGLYYRIYFANGQALWEQVVFTPPQ